jgi:hypothetical protein
MEVISFSWWTKSNFHRPSPCNVGCQNLCLLFLVRQHHQSTCVTVSVVGFGICWAQHQGPEAGMRGVHGLETDCTETTSQLTNLTGRAGPWLGTGKTPGDQSSLFLRQRPKTGTAPGPAPPMKRPSSCVRRGREAERKADSDPTFSLSCSFQIFLSCLSKVGFLK